MTRDRASAPPEGAHPRTLRATLAQFKPNKGRVSENLERIRSIVEERARAGDQLVVFPETVCSGYHVEGGVEEVARTPGAVIEALGAPPEGAPDLVLGFYEDGGDAVYNAALHLTPGAGEWEPTHLHRKLFLPTYGVFQEARFVTPGREAAAFDTRFGRMGLLVCEDLLHSLLPTVLALDGAEVLVALAATPARDFGPGAGRPRSLERWDVAARAIALEHSRHLILAHLVGSEGGLLFAGGSAVYGPGATVLARAPLFDEAIVPVELDLEAARRARARAPLLSDLETRLPTLRRALRRVERRPAAGDAPPAGDDPSAASPAPAPTDPAEPNRTPIDPDDGSFLDLDLPLVEDALVAFLRDEVRERRGFERVVVGVSGGVDSAVTLALAARALGPDAVDAFLLPYATSSPESLEHGRRVAEQIGVRHRTIPVTEAVDGYIEAEEPEISPRRRGNVTARTRATILWDQAARLEALPLGTGNKTERLLGYFTWHADDSPPINPLGDLLKTQVWALARHLDVPPEIVDKPPSPDLVVGVDDEAELGVGYLLADRILHWLLEGVPAPALTRAGFDPEAVEIVAGRLRSTHWKRRLPTVAMLSSTAIGEFYLRPVDF